MEEISIYHFIKSAGASIWLSLLVDVTVNNTTNAVRKISFIG